MVLESDTGNVAEIVVVSFRRETDMLNRRQADVKGCMSERVFTEITDIQVTVPFLWSHLKGENGHGEVNLRGVFMQFFHSGPCPLQC